VHAKPLDFGDGECYLFFVHLHIPFMIWQKKTAPACIFLLKAQEKLSKKNLGLIIAYFTFLVKGSGRLWRKNPDRLFVHRDFILGHLKIAL